MKGINSILGKKKKYSAQEKNNTYKKYNKIQSKKC